MCDGKYKKPFLSTSPHQLTLRNFAIIIIKKFGEKLFQHADVMELKQLFPHADVVELKQLFPHADVGELKQLFPQADVVELKQLSQTQMLLSWIYTLAFVTGNITSFSVLLI